MGSVLKFKQTSIPRQTGEMARLKVNQGPDYGTTFIIVGAKATIGRGDENDIVLSDLKASRVHAELTFSKDGWRIQDKQSANGILYNGKATRQARLVLKDTITLGETTLEFNPSEAGTLLLLAPPRTIEQVQGDQRKLEEHQKKVGAMGLRAVFGTEAPGSTSESAPGQSKRTFFIFGVAALAAVWLLVPGGDPPSVESPKKSEKNSDTSRNLASYLPDFEVSKASETLFKDGFREYLAGNYTRARTQFETVLQISPGHTLARVYLVNCQKSVEADVKLHLEYGKKTFKAGKLRDARAHFERVMRLLYRDQSNANYIEAKDQYEKVKVQMTQESPG